MRQLKAEHIAHRFLAERGNLVKPAFVDQVRLDHPGAAAAKDLVKRQIAVEVGGIDAAGRHKLHIDIRGGNRLDIVDAARLLRREEFNHIESELDRLFHIGRIGASGRDRDSLFDTIGHDLGIQSRADNEFCARIDRAVNLLGGQDSARTDQHIRDLFRNPADRLFALCGTEGHFGAGKAALLQCFGQRDRLVHIVNFDYGYNANLGELFQNCIHLLHLILVHFGSVSLFHNAKPGSVLRSIPLL